MPPLHPNSAQAAEEALRDALVRLGLQEVMTYRMTSVEAEAALTPPDAAQPVVEYVQLKNPLTPERSVMRRSLLGSVLEIARKTSVKVRILHYSKLPQFSCRKRIQFFHKKVNG